MPAAHFAERQTACRRYPTHPTAKAMPRDFYGSARGRHRRADYRNEAYEWTLTYRGGPEKTDVVLTDPETILPGGRRAAYTTGKPAMATVLTREQVESGLREMARRQTAL